MTRREFVHRSTLIALAAPLSRRRVEALAPTTLRIGVAGALSADGMLGAKLGVEEATHAAQLFGAAIETTSLSARTPSDRGLSAIVGGADAVESVVWAKHAAEMGAVYMNVTSTSDELRGASCSRAAFHVIPSDAMSRDAAGMAGGSESSNVVAWDASLARFGADTLNQRFRDRFGRPMTSDAWTAWMAVKILWEASLRAKSADGAALAAYLEREGTQFDGHKGQPLSFRAWDHQLRQPVYVAGAGAQHAKGGPAVRELPDVAPTDSPRAALDRLGTTGSGSACRFAR